MTSPRQDHLEVDRRRSVCMPGASGSMERRRSPAPGRLWPRVRVERGGPGRGICCTERSVALGGIVNSPNGKKKKAAKRREVMRSSSASAPVVRKNGSRASAPPRTDGNSTPGSSSDRRRSVPPRTSRRREARAKTGCVMPRDPLGAHPGCSPVFDAACWLELLTRNLTQSRIASPIIGV
jgi:hypothetical protein